MEISAFNVKKEWKKKKKKNVSSQHLHENLLKLFSRINMDIIISQNWVFEKFDTFSGVTFSVAEIVGDRKLTSAWIFIIPKSIFGMQSSAATWGPL